MLVFSLNKDISILKCCILQTIHIQHKFECTVLCKVCSSRERIKTVCNSKQWNDTTGNLAAAV